MLCLGVVLRGLKSHQATLVGPTNNGTKLSIAVALRLSYTCTSAALLSVCCAVTACNISVPLTTTDRFLFFFPFTKPPDVAFVPLRHNTSDRTPVHNSTSTLAHHAHTLRKTVTCHCRSWGLRIKDRYRSRTPSSHKRSRTALEVSQAQSRTPYAGRIASA